MDATTGTLTAHCDHQSQLWLDGGKAWESIMTSLDSRKNGGPASTITSRCLRFFGPLFLGTRLQTSERAQHEQTGDAGHQHMQEQPAILSDTGHKTKGFLEKEFAQISCQEIVVTVDLGGNRWPRSRTSSRILAILFGDSVRKMPKPSLYANDWCGKRVAGEMKRESSLNFWLTKTYLHV